MFTLRVWDLDNFCYKVDKLLVSCGYVNELPHASESNMMPINILYVDL